VGTWDHGLFDNDGAFDALGDLCSTAACVVIELGALKPTQARAERIAGAVGLLLQLAPESYFWTESEEGKTVVKTLGTFVAANGAALLSAAARKIVVAVAAGTQAMPVAKLAKTTAKQLHIHDANSFGVRHAALFSTPGAQAVVAQLAKEITGILDEDFEDEANWSDLCREGIGMGGLGFLLVMSPMPVKATKLTRWRKLSQKGIAALEAAPDDGELAFHRKYYANLDKVFAAVLKRAI
jgi:hypothetical protein